jgi:hypothetical protein
MTGRCKLQELAAAATPDFWNKLQTGCVTILEKIVQEDL